MPVPKACKSLSKTRVYQVLDGQDLLAILSPCLCQDFGASVLNPIESLGLCPWSPRGFMVRSQTSLKEVLDTVVDKWQPKGLLPCHGKYQASGDVTWVAECCIHYSREIGNWTRKLVILLQHVHDLELAASLCTWDWQQDVSYWLQLLHFDTLSLFFASQETAQCMQNRTSFVLGPSTLWGASETFAEHFSS